MDEYKDARCICKILKEKSLSITRHFYALYKDRCSESDLISVKHHNYSDSFNNDFNIGFMISKKNIDMTSASLEESMLTFPESR